MLTHSRPSPEQVRDFVIAGHGDFEKVKQMLTEYPELLNAPWQWSETDAETAIQAAAQVGNVQIAEYLLDRGAPLTICTAAMLGRKDQVERLLDEDPDSIQATGAHGIPLLAHAVLSGNPDLVELVFQRGAKVGASLALHNAIAKRDYELVRWLVKKAKPDLASKNYQGKTPLAVAVEHRFDEIAQVLRDHGATE